MFFTPGTAVFHYPDGVSEIGCGRRAHTLAGLTESQQDYLDSLRSDRNLSPRTRRARELGEDHAPLVDAMRRASFVTDTDTVGDDPEQRRVLLRDGHTRCLSARATAAITLRVHALPDPLFSPGLATFLDALVDELTRAGFTRIAIVNATGASVADLTCAMSPQWVQRLSEPSREPALTIPIFARTASGAALTDLHLRGLDHLVVVRGEEEAQIGPYVRVGITPCVECMDLHASSVDPQWVRRQRDSITQPAPAISDTLDRLTALLLARAVSDIVDADTVVGYRASPSLRLLFAPGEVRFIDGDLSVERTLWEPHPHCTCRVSLLDPVPISERS